MTHILTLLGRGRMHLIDLSCRITITAQQRFTEKPIGWLLEIKHHQPWPFLHQSISPLISIANYETTNAKGEQGTTVTEVGDCRIIMSSEDGRLRADAHMNTYEHMNIH